MLLDTGASDSMTGYKGDFLPGILKKLPKPIVFDGIAGSQHATHYGIAHYETFDDNDELVSIDHQVLYVPNLHCRLLSPQTYYTWICHHGGGEKHGRGTGEDACG